MPHIYLLFSLIFFCCNTLALTPDDVIAGAEQMYRQRMTELDQRAGLDLDAVFLARVNRIAQQLVLQAKRDYPAAVEWRWEIHVSSDSDDMAFCMAGGKLLISQAHVIALSLSDAELAMLLGHEMQHALQQHNLKEYQEALRLFPAWNDQAFSALEEAVDNDASLIRALAPLNFLQEIEADTEGMKLAWRAGWQAGKLAIYFKKLMRASTTPHFDSASHPASARRWQAARSLAEILDSGNLPATPLAH
jgi:predicted Zn-dependent protease